MNLTFKENVNEKEFNEFTYNHAHGTFFQSSQWAKVKAEWDAIYTGVYDGDKLVSVCLVLKRHLPLNYSILYAPRGPILDFENKQLLEYTLQQLQTVAKNHGAISFTIDPYIVRSEYSMIAASKGVAEPVYDDHLIESFENNRFMHQGFTMQLTESFQPRFTPYLNLVDDAYKKSRAYKAGGRSVRNGVKVRRGDKEDMTLFTELIQKTEEHKNISLRSSEYFSRLMSEYKEDCLLSFAYVDLEDLLKTNEHTKEDLLKRLDNPTIKEGRRREYESQVSNTEKEIEFIKELQKNHDNIVNIAGILALKNGNKAELLYAGMDRDFQKYAGSNVNYIDVMDWALEHDVNYLSFGGCSGTFDEGIDRFKMTFDPNVCEYIGEFTYVNKRFMNYLFTKALAFRRN